MPLLLLFLPLMLFAATLQVGESVAPALIRDQFRNPHIVGSERAWVVTWDKLTTRRANTYFDTRRKMLEDKTAALIVDVSQTPAGIMELFVTPRMQGYEHPILLSHDGAYNAALPYREDHITVLCLEEKKIVKILFARDAHALKTALEAGCKPEGKTNAKP